MHRVAFYTGFLIFTVTVLPLVRIYPELTNNHAVLFITSPLLQCFSIAVGYADTLF